MTKLAVTSSILTFLALAACSSAPSSDATSAADALHGCHGKASSSIPPSGVYYLTTFGGPSESQMMSCGKSTKSGTWYYAASRQRYGCGAHLQVEANGACVVVEAADYGPDVCVETAAGKPILDASPLVAEALFGSKSEGWSDHAQVTVTEVDSSTPLGPCASNSSSSNGGGSSQGGNGGGGASCSSDGDCNPGSEGSGQICVQGTCTPGCNADWQCPGNQVCVSGSCQ